jgi:hypothetical protein
MIRAHTAALALVTCLSSSNASAQESRTTTVTLTPAAPSRWDTAAHVTWLGERLNRPTDWSQWYDVGSGGADIGYYWTSHLKTEFDVSTSTRGETYSFEQLALPGSPSPLFLQQSHEFRITTASAGVNAQFLENAWVHPFVGAGIELLRERERIETVPIPARPGAPIVPSPGPESRVRYAGRPFLAAGFKGYVSERVFIRSDLRTSWSSAGVTAIAWRNGIGFDF